MAQSSKNTLKGGIQAALWRNACTGIESCMHGQPQAILIYPAIA